VLLQIAAVVIKSVTLYPGCKIHGRNCDTLADSFCCLQITHLHDVENILEAADIV